MARTISPRAISCRTPAFAKKPLVTAAVGTFDGTLTTIRAHERGQDGLPNPTYRCLFPEPPPPGTVPACAEAGILGALVGVLGSMMALEVIREIVGFGEGLVGRLLMVDARAMRFETLNYAWDETNPLSGKNPTIKDLSSAYVDQFRRVFRLPTQAICRHQQPALVALVSGGECRGRDCPREKK